MTEEDVKRYLHPKEKRYFPLAVFAGAPFALFFILMTIASFGMFALLAAGVLFLVWVSVRMYRARLLGYAAKVDEHNFPSPPRHAGGDQANARLRRQGGDVHR